MMKLSARIQNIETSKTVRFTPLIEALRRQGREIIDFAVGEPAFDTPGAVIDATRKALGDQQTKYGPSVGLTQLRADIAAGFNGYDRDNVIICNGSKQALYSLFQVLCDPGDEVIVPVPAWVSFSQQIRLAGARPVFVDTRRHQLDCVAIAAAVTARTRAIVINSPNNPTGAVYPGTDLERIARLAAAENLYVISDEAYERFVYDGLAHESVFSIEAARERVVVIGSLSKSYNMTGFRVGFAAGPKEIIEAMTRLQSHLCGNVCTFAQFGAIEALKLDTAIFDRRRVELEASREVAFSYATRFFDCIRPQGAFYIFPDVSRRLKPGESAADFSARLLESAGVAVIPGEAFGVKNHIRIFYALPEAQLIRGFEQIGRAL